MTSTDNHFDDHSLTEFEQQLKRLQPVGCDDLTAETFYQAGWNAAVCGEVSAEASVVGSSTDDGRHSSRNYRRQHLASIRFVLGVLCGMVISTTGMYGWQLATTGGDGVSSQSPVVADVTPAATDSGIHSNDTAEPIVADADQATEVAGGPEQLQPVTSMSLVSQLFPWNWQSESYAASAIVPDAAQPLSPVARNSWMNLVAADRNRAVQNRSQHSHAADRPTSSPHNLTPSSLNRIPWEDFL
jgi:hypothetical protein